MDYIKEAKKLGFSNAAIMDTQKLVFKPEYRKFCEENQCGYYKERLLLIYSRTTFQSWSTFFLLGDIQGRT